MVATIALSPNLVGHSQGSFSKTTAGLIQGTAYPDPAIRYKLRGGQLLTTETLPVWGGVAMFADVPGAAGGPSGALGTLMGRSTSLTGVKPINGFSVFDQDYSMIQTPQSQVPLAGTGMEINWYALGSGARIALAMNPALISLQGKLITTQVSWDFVNQQLTQYSPAYANVTITGATWAGTSGGQTTFTVGTDLSAILVAGDVINVFGVVSTGGLGTGYNGEWVVAATPSSTQVVVTQLSASSPGTYSSGGTITGGGGALPCEILEVQAGNSMTVVWDPVNLVANYDYVGFAAVVKI